MGSYRITNSLLSKSSLEGESKAYCKMDRYTTTLCVREIYPKFRFGPLRAKAVLALPKSRSGFESLKRHPQAHLALQISQFAPATCPSHFKSAPWSEIALRPRPISAPLKRP